MTDNEIIKALEYCANCENCFYGTTNCPLGEEMECRSLLAQNALDLITSQQAENENLKVENQSLRTAANSLKMHYEEAQAEIENLKNENFILSQKRANIFEITEAYGRGKSEAVKEFADRLKKDIFNTEYHIDRYYRRSIDKLVKEMAGKNNSDE